MADRQSRLERRVDRLEAQLTMLRRAVTGSRRGGSVVQAPFRVVDARGEPILTVDVAESGPLLCLGAMSDGGAVVLEVDAQGGRITLTHHAGERVATLGVGETGGRFDLFDDVGRWSLTAYATPEGGALYVLNSEGQQVAGLEGTNSGGQVYVHDQEGRPAASLVGAAGAGRLHIMGQTGAQAAAIFATAEGGRITVADTGGESAASLGSDTYGGMLRLACKPDDPWLKWPVAGLFLTLSALTYGLFTAAARWDTGPATLARLLCLWWGTLGLAMTVLITVSPGASWQRGLAGRYRISALAMVIGLWIGQGGAPWWALPVLPVSAALESTLWRRFLPPRGEERYIPLPIWLGYLCLGEAFGFLAGLWIAGAFG